MMINVNDSPVVDDDTTAVVLPAQPASFCWWALSRIVMLLQFDLHGVHHSLQVFMYTQLLFLFTCLFIATI